MAAQPKRLIEHIADTVQALHSCKAGRGHSDWIAKHEDTLAILAKELPYGSGIDSGTQIDLDRSNGAKVVLTFGFHFMDQHGMYAGWGDFQAVIRPAFHGIDVEIKGRNRNGIKEYLYQTYEYALTRMYTHEYSSDRGNTFERVQDAA